MEEYQFVNAKAIWKRKDVQNYNQFIGFYTCIEVPKEQKLTFAIAARSYYRLYIDGEMAANGPARTAKGYCRVDETVMELSGRIHVAVEVLAIDKPEKYCNDCTLEPGMLNAEIIGQDGTVYASTGKSEWKCRELTYRRMNVEMMSHSRGIVEWYDLNPQSSSWRMGECADFENPEITEGEVTYLRRRAPYPDYKAIAFERLQKIADQKYAGVKNAGVKNRGIEDADIKHEGTVMKLARMMNPRWYEQIPKENYFLESLRSETECKFTGEFLIGEAEKSGKYLKIRPGQEDFSVVWNIRESEVGFIDFTVKADGDCVLDVINTDHTDQCGKIRANTYATRYILAKGEYHLTTFEPKLTKYIKIIFRTEKGVEIQFPRLLRYTYPDCGAADFECNDGDLNRIYEASKRTLRLNTLDIFMDCPQRERGGWLCDSQFTAYGAWQMFGDLTVEKDFLENFMLTDADAMDHAFFPEVYPGSKTRNGDPGIMNWSFWLITELADYYERSGDVEFVEQCRERVTRFIEGLLSLRGRSGLIEDMDAQFVDWSLSNREFCLQPVSVPNNCLAVYMLERISAVYEEEAWKTAACEMRAVIEALDTDMDIFGGGGDAAIYKDGALKRGDCATESGIALELWGRFHLNDKKYIRRFVDAMGYSPKYCPEPNIGRANLFIGLMIRFSVLARLGEIEQLVKEMRELYLPELRIGAGTFFENYSGFSGCHGFNAAAGAYLTNYLLGLGEPKQLSKTIKISPHPCGCLWAAGSARCDDGEFFMSWNADYSEHSLDILLQMPRGWSEEYEIPFELTGWEIRINGKVL